jgi:aspartate/methionine/tyrosine aminotransferase
MLKIHDCISICAPHIGQKAVLHGLKVGRAWQDEKKQSVRRKRKLLIEAINKVPTGFEVISSGGFFVWVRHPFQRMTSWQVVEELLLEAGILVLPGGLFGDGQEDKLRISFANLSESEICELGDRLMLLNAEP